MRARIGASKRLAIRAVSAFLADDGPVLAGAVAYQIFFALLPLTMLAVGVLGFVLDSEQARRQLAALLSEVSPIGTGHAEALVDGVVAARAPTLALGVVGTALAGGALYGALAVALAPALGRRAPGGVLHAQVRPLMLIGALATIVVASVLLSALTPVAASALRGRGLPGGAAALEIASPWIGALAGYLTLRAIYRIVPARRIRAGAARTASAVTAVSWEVVKTGLGIAAAVGWGSAYGPLAFTAGLLLSAYATAAVMILGAYLAREMSDRKTP